MGYCTEIRPTWAFVGIIHCTTEMYIYGFQGQMKFNSLLAVVYRSLKGLADARITRSTSIASKPNALSSIPDMPPISFTASFSDRLTMRVLPHLTRHSIAADLQHAPRLSVHILQLHLVRTQHVLRKLIPVDH